MKLLCSKDFLYPCYRTVCSESSELIRSTHVFTSAENFTAFQIFENAPYCGIAMASLREHVKVQNTRRRFSALSSVLGGFLLYSFHELVVLICH